MLSFVKGFLFGVFLAIAGVLWFAYTHHVIRTEEGLSVVTKTQNTFQNIFVDTRGWGTLDYIRNDEVSKALANRGLMKTKELADKSLQETKEAVEKSLGEARTKLKGILEKIPDRKQEAP